MYKYKAIVLEVLDAETVKVAIDLGFGIVTNQKVKLAGIDGSEFRDKKNPDKETELKKIIEDGLLRREVSLKSLKAEKSGRYLAFLYLDNETKSFNDKLVEEGHIKGYVKRESRIGK